MALGLGVLALLVGCGLWLAHGAREAGAAVIASPPVPHAAAPHAPRAVAPTVAPAPEIVPVHVAVDRTVQPGEGITAYEERVGLPTGAVRLWLGLQGRTTLFAGEEPDPEAVQAAARVLAATPAPTVALDQPHYDDPTIQSGGSLGTWQTGQGTEQPRYDDPTIQSGGSFGGGQQVAPPVVESGPAVAAPPALAAPQYNDPTLASGGSFGGGQATPLPVRPQYNDPTIHSGGSFGSP